MRIVRQWRDSGRNERHRRDVYIRTDGERWEVEAQVGGDNGRSTVHQCPGRQSAEILAQAWMGGRGQWKLVVL